MNRCRRGWISIVAAMLIMASGGASHGAGDPATDVATMSLDSIRARMEIMETRPLAIMVLVDGWGADYARRVLLDDEYRARHGVAELPTLRRLFEESARVEVSTVSTPTLSANNIATLLSGLSQGNSGEGNGFNPLPGFAYVDRANDRWIWTLVPDAFQLDEILAEGGRNVFQVLQEKQTFAFGAAFSEGADVRYSVALGDTLRKIVPGFQESRALDALEKRSRREVELSKLRREIIQQIDEIERSDRPELLEARVRRQAEGVLEHAGEGLPDFLYWYNPWIDHDLHYQGYDAAVLLQKRFPELEKHVSRILTLYAAPDLPAAARQNLLVALVSDHGVHITERRFDFEKFLGQHRIPFSKTFEERSHLKALAKNVKFDIDTRKVVVSSTAGGYVVLDLFHDDAFAPGKTGWFSKRAILDRARWRQHPTYSHCRDFSLDGERRIDWIQLLTREMRGAGEDGQPVPVIEYLAVREDDHTKDRPRIRLVSAEGEARIERRREAGGGLTYRYSVLEGQDPLRYRAAGGTLASMLASDAFHSDLAWQEATCDTAKPDGLHPLMQLFDMESSGTLVAFVAPRWRFFVDYPARHAGESREERVGIQCYSGPAARTGVRLPTARAGSVPVTVVHHLMGDGFAPADFDYPSLLPAIR